MAQPRASTASVSASGHAAPRGRYDKDDPQEEDGEEEEEESSEAEDA